MIPRGKLLHSGADTLESHLWGTVACEGTGLPAFRPEETAVEG